MPANDHWYVTTTKQKEVNMSNFLSQAIQTGTFEDTTQVIIARLLSVETARPTRAQKARGEEEGNQYCKMQFAGLDENGNPTLRKLINVFFIESATRDITIMSKDAGKSLFLIQGVMTISQTQVNGQRGNDVITLSEATLCRYGEDGFYHYEDDGKVVTRKGGANDPVKLVHKRTGKLQKAPQLVPLEERQRPRVITVQTARATGGNTEVAAEAAEEAAIGVNLV